jgi:hypothetical protein
MVLVKEKKMRKVRVQSIDVSQINRSFSLPYLRIGNRENEILNKVKSNMLNLNLNKNISAKPSPY